MKGIAGLVAGTTLCAAGLAISGPAMRVSATSTVNITYRLTLYGNVPANDGFVANFGQNGVQMCGPCAGGGKTYLVTTPWQQSSDPIHVVFLRFNVPQSTNGSSSVQPVDRFGQQSITPTQDQTVNAVFDYRQQTSTAPKLLTFTFTLTINGTPGSGDSFSVMWGETGLQMCAAPCVGAGHSYVQTMTFPEGVTETFVFIRSSSAVSPGHPGQQFGQQTATANGDRTVASTFTYGAAGAATPSTGSSAPVPTGALLAGIGGGLLVLLLLLRLHRQRHISA